MLPTPCAAASCGLHVAIVLCTLIVMTVQQKTVHKKRMGRPPGKTYGETIPARLTPELAMAIAAWAKQAGVSRSEAIRRLVEQGLKGKR
jgi:predicted HicB family RNase H-like nuclease